MIEVNNFNMSSPFMLPLLCIQYAMSSVVKKYCKKLSLYLFEYIFRNGSKIRIHHIIVRIDP